MSLIPDPPIVSENNNKATVQWIMQNTSEASAVFNDPIISTKAKIFEENWFIKISSSNDGLTEICLITESKSGSMGDRKIEYNFRIIYKNVNEFFHRSGELLNTRSWRKFDAGWLCTNSICSEDLSRIFEKRTFVTIICTLKWLNLPVCRTCLHPKLKNRQDIPKINLPKGPETATNYLRELLDSGRHADVNFMVKGQTIQAHQLILQVRCTYFESMFNHNTMEKITKKIVVPDFDPEIFKDFLRYLYIGQVEGDTVAAASELYRVADKYGVSELKNACKEFMVINLSAESFIKTLFVAFLCDDSELMKPVTKYFDENGLNIVETSEWLELLKNCPNAANTVLKGMFQMRYSADLTETAGSPVFKKNKRRKLQKGICQMGST